MARRRITLKWAAKCRDCGADLEAGSLARWYGRGRVYGIGCHEDTRKGGGQDGGAVYEPDGGGHCEDYPCCGHGSGMCASERRAERRAAAKPAARVTPQLAAPAGLTPLGLPEETPSDYPQSYNDRAQELMGDDR